MAIIKKNYDYLFDLAIIDIEVMAMPMHKAVHNRMSFNKFFELCDSDETKAQRYARANKTRADLLFEQINDIANHTDEDHTPFTGGNVVQRDKLRIDALKWQLSKMNPKKYGDKIQTEVSGTLRLGAALAEDEAKYIE